MPVDDRCRLDPDALERMLKKDVAEGRTPACIVATVGTTGVAALDPVRDIAALAEEFGVWLHVDGALAGSAMLLEEQRAQFDGVEKADSLSFNPHKWMGTALDCSILFVRRPQELVAVMSTDPSYLKTHRADDVTQLRDWGIPLGRRFRALKLWFHLRLDGAEAIRSRLRRDLANAAWLAAQIEEHPDWELTAPVSLQTLCMRHVIRDAHGEPLTGEDMDSHTLAWVEAINASGRAYLTPFILHGQWTGRVTIGAEPTELADVKGLWELMKGTAEAME